MLQNAYFFAKIGADTAENRQHFAEILPIGRGVAAGRVAPAPRGRGPDPREGAPGAREAEEGLLGSK